ncbi:MAG: precorrin-2 dehydrogenase/sirohydrochlorin ferrochelatase family protein [Flavobacteriales bacterium]
MSAKTTSNPLYPIFLLPERLNILVVGGGNVGLEKLTSLIKNSPQANVKMVASDIFEETKVYAAEHNIPTTQKSFSEEDLEGINILFIAINNKEESAKIRAIAKTKNILVNVADTPDLCDFYLGSVVTKGDLKIGISTNGKSPTLSKRIREYMEEALPDSTQDLIDNLGKIRSTLTGDFQSKVEQLNAITKNMVETQNNANTNKSSIFKRLFRGGK